jgi:hypothetical protein
VEDEHGSRGRELMIMAQLQIEEKWEKTQNLSISKDKSDRFIPILWLSGS